MSKNTEEYFSTLEREGLDKQREPGDPLVRIARALEKIARILDEFHR